MAASPLSRQNMETPPVLMVTGRARWVYAIVAAAAVLLFVLVGATGTGQPGFPLDDGWIHQTFARAVAWRGEWAYNPGAWVAGSTSPLWTLLLTPPYLLWHGTSANPVDGGGLLLFQAWAYLLGALALGVAAAETDTLARRVLLRLWPGAAVATMARIGWLAGLCCIAEWRLVWAAASGMETTLFIALMLWLYNRAATVAERVRGGSKISIAGCAGLGLAAGALVLVRPEGAVLAVLVAVALAGRWRGMVAFGGGFLLPMLPDALFNLAVSGTPLPTTFYAKGSAYAGADKTLAFLVSPDPATGGIAVLLHGPAVLFVPGVLVAAAAWRARGRVPILGLWPFVFLLLYAWRLPVTYQHGRYLLPLVPFVLAWGVAGYAVGLRGLRAARLGRVAQAVPLLVGVGLVVAAVSGLQTYYYDVKFFNWNEVQVGRWLRDAAPQGTAIATHDIGAIGYFAGYGAPADPHGHVIIDTAGLISPAYVPIVLDQDAIRRRLATDHARFLAMLPDWYDRLGPALEAEHRLVYTPPPADLGLASDVNMRVYRLE